MNTHQQRHVTFSQIMPHSFLFTGNFRINYLTQSLSDNIFTKVMKQTIRQSRKLENVRDKSKRKQSNKIEKQASFLIKSMVLTKNEEQSKSRRSFVNDNYLNLIIHFCHLILFHQTKFNKQMKLIKILINCLVFVRHCIAFVKLT